MAFLASWLPFGTVRASASARRAALASARIERIDDPEHAPTFIAGGHQTDGALPVATPRFDAAVYCSRGRGYARYNEDAAGLFVDGHGRLYAWVLDQAGGLGGKVRGQGSQVAANHIFDACQRIAREDSQAPEGVEEALRTAFDRAHRVLVQRGEGEVTTAIAAVLEGEGLSVLCSGDSAALVYGTDGKVRVQTRLQELDGINQGCLAHAIGLVPEGSAPECYRWTLSPGEWLIAATDGLLDAGLEDAAIAKILAQAAGAEDAVNRLCTLVLRRMGTFRAKPDNLTVVAVRANRSA